jgi:2-(1,2-epoxy-1,2-dihydrophenyl)acetyl-CoA isomerase
VVVTGRGRFFCAGGDIQAFSSAGDQLPDFLREITSHLHSAISPLMRMNKPLVSAVNGPVAGGGIGLAIAGDIVLADPSAHFTLAYTGIGLSPDGGASWLLPRLIGLRRAQELCLTNRRVGAAEAAAMGLVTRVVEEGQLEAETQATAKQLARSATTALGATRRLLLESLANSLESQMELESRTIAAQGATAEGREGVAAFIAKRPPRYTEVD